MTSKDFELTKSDTVEPDKGKSSTVKPVTVLPDYKQKPSVEVLQQAIATAKRKPRIGVYSPIVSAAAEYLRETIPKYSASDEARKILEDEFEKRYPELVKQIKSGMEQGNYVSFNIAISTGPEVHEKPGQGRGQGDKGPY